MKNLFKLILLVSAGAFFAACNNDNLETTEPVEPGAGEVYTGPVAVKTLGFTLPEMTEGSVALTKADLEEDADAALSLGAAPASRATVAADAAEKTIKSVTIVQFDNASSKVVTSSVIPASDITGNTTSGYSVEAPLAEVASTIYVFANVNGTLPTNTVGTALSAFTAGEITFNGPILDTELTTKGLPMMGKATLAAGAETATVNMEFLVARIRTTITNSLSGFTPTKVDIIGVPKFMPLTAPTGNTTLTGKTDANFFNIYTTGASYAAKTTGLTGAALTFYVPELKAGTVAGLTAKTKSWWDAPTRSMCIRITGTIGSRTVKYEIYPGANNTTDFNVVRNTAYTINPTIKGKNATSDLRASADGITDLNADGKFANCYMVDQAGKTYYFNATKKGNATNTTGITDATTAIAPTKAAQLWSTGSATYVIRKYKFMDNKIYFSTSGTLGSVTEGNALIAGQNASNTNLWSWHIWSTNYANASGSTSTTEDYTVRPGATTGASPAPTATLKFMTRNLGAANNTVGDPASFGLLYQWGRKDPFVGAAGTSGTTYAASTMDQSWPSTASTSTTGTIGWTIQNPTTFLTQCNTVTYDWIYTGAQADAQATQLAKQNNNLWGNPSSITGTIAVTNLNKNNPAKSVYDPCPKGFKVPPQYAWTRFTITGNNSSTTTEFNVSGSFNVGWVFFRQGDKTGATTYYPAAGYRNAETGALTYVGTSGYSLSSSPLSSGSALMGYLSFNSGYVSPVGSWYRSAGFTVRCVQEL